MVKNENFILLLTSNGQEWQFDIAIDNYWLGKAISYCYLHLVIKNVNLTFLMTSIGQEWQLHIDTDI